MTRLVIRILAVLIVFVAGCASDSSTSTASTPGRRCQKPPAKELVAQSNVVLTLEPNPVAATAEASLSVSAEGLDSEAVVGAGAFWQCWDGSQWIDTHHIVRGNKGDYRTRALEQGVTVTIPAVGLLLPNTYSILIPDVEPGTYRIGDHVWSGGMEIIGFVIIEVR